MAGRGAGFGGRFQHRYSLKEVATEMGWTVGAVFVVQFQAQWRAAKVDPNV